MSTINDRWYQEYLATQFPYDLRRYDLTDLQPSDLDDLKQDLFVAYAEEITIKRNYLRATRLQQYFNTMLTRRVMNWAIRKSKENKRMRTNQNVEAGIKESGSIDLGHPVYRNLNRDYLGTVLLYYHGNFTAEDIARFRRSTPKAVNSKLDRAREIMKNSIS